MITYLVGIQPGAEGEPIYDGNLWLFDDSKNVAQGVNPAILAGIPDQSQCQAVRNLLAMGQRTIDAQEAALAKVTKERDRLRAEREELAAALRLLWGWTNQGTTRCPSKVAEKVAEVLARTGGK
jgi:hypothetical protein